MKYVPGTGQVMSMNPKIMVMDVISPDSNIERIEVFVEDNKIPLYVGARFTCVVHAIHTTQ